MDNNLLPALIAGLGAMLSWGVADFLAKRAIDKEGDLRTLFWAQLIGVIPILALMFSPYREGSFSFNDWLFLIVFAVIDALGYFFLYKGFGKGQVSLLSPIFASYSVVAVIISVWFFGENIPVVSLWGIGAVFTGLVLIGGHPKEFWRLLTRGKHSTAGIIEIIVAVLLYASWFVLFDKFVSGKDWVINALWLRILVTVFIGFYDACVPKFTVKVQHKYIWKYLVGVGLFDAAASCFVAYGFSVSSYPSIITMLSATFSLPTMILAHIYLKEKITIIQLLAAAIIIVGIALVAIN